MSYTLREYGSNIRKIVDHILTIEDKDERTKKAYSLVHLMKQLHSSNPNMHDPDNKFWDDLYIMSNFKLDIDAPFPMPDPDSIGKRPQRMQPNHHDIRFKHYGHNIALLIKKAVEIEDDEAKEQATIYICKLMKSFYAVWNNQAMENKVILEQLNIMSKGRLTLDPAKVEEENLLYDARDKRKQAIVEEVDSKHDNRFNRKVAATPTPQRGGIASNRNSNSRVGASTPNNRNTAQPRSNGAAPRTNSRPDNRTDARSSNNNFDRRRK